MRRAVLTLVLVAASTVWAAGDGKVIGEIEFYGYKGLDVGAVRAVLPMREGDAFPPPKAKSSDDLKSQFEAKVKQAMGLEPTDVNFTCCDAKQNWMIYIGLPGASYRAVEWNAAPTGDVRFPKAVLALREAAEKAMRAAVMKGNATEDDSEGYALLKDPKARKAQLALREYALANEDLILRVLATSSDSRHRAIAAQLLGYAREHGRQIDGLVRASLDPDDGVRNDAIRALAVLAGAKPELAKRMPLRTFAGLLRSGNWSDHNKASLLLMNMTKGRDAGALAMLRDEALDTLLEMARWRSPGHAAPALIMLGRIAGIEEDALSKMIEVGQASLILANFDAR